MSSAYDIPQVKAQEMTSEGCRIDIGGQWSGPLPDRDSGIVLAALVAAALACIPPYLLIISRRRQKR